MTAHDTSIGVTSVTGPAPNHGGGTPPDDDVFWQELDAAESNRSRALDAALSTVFPSMYDHVELLAKTRLSTTWKALNRHTKTFEVIKAPTLEVLDNDRLREQFRQEVQIAASLDHPCIVQLRYPSLDNQPWFFTMPFVDGRHLDHFCDGERLGIRDRLKVFLKICDAVSYAHEHGILHRDLKPNNIRVTADGHPKLLDFGIGRFLKRASSEVARSRSPATPGYMAPEQADDTPGSMRTDLYSLGVILYELLTGRLPFDPERKTWREHVRQIQQEQPVPPREIRPEIGRELDAIILKATARNPNDRYATVAQFSRDLREFLDGGIIDIWRHRRGYVLRKSVRRYRVAIAILGAFFLLLAVSATTFWRQTRELQRRDYFNRIALAENALRSSNAARTKDLLQGCPKGLRAWEWGWLHWLSDRSLDTWNVSDAPLDSLDISPDGARVAIGSLAGTIQILAVSTDQVVHRMHHAHGPLRSILFSPDGASLATAGADANALLWNASTGQKRGQIISNTQYTKCLAYSPTGHLIATTNNAYDVEIWETITYQRLVTLTGHSDYVNDLCFNASGSQIVSGSSDGTVRVWDVDSRALIKMFDYGEEVRCVASSLDGRLAFGGDDFTICTSDIDDADDGGSAGVFYGHADKVRALAFSPNGALLVSASDDNTVRLWDARTYSELVSLTGHDGYVSDVTFSPDGDLVYSIGEDGTLRSWDASLRGNVLDLRGHWHGVNSVAINNDGTRLLSASGDRTVRLWDTQSGEEVATLRGHSGHVNAAVWDPAEHRIASASADGTIRIWDLRDSIPRIRIIRGHSDEVTSVAFSPEGDILYSSSKDGTIASWAPGSGQAQSRWAAHDGAVRDIAVDPGGNRIASAGGDGMVRLWNARTGTLAGTLKGHNGRVSSVTFGPRSYLASCGADGNVILWNVKNGKLIRRLGAHAAPGATAVFSPDGRRLFTFGRNGIVKIWAVTGGTEVLAIGFPGFEFNCGTISSKGNMLCVGGNDGCLWMLETDKVTDSLANRRQETREIRRLVDDLFEQHHTVHGIERALASNPTLSGLPHDAILLARRRGDDPTLLRARAWEIASHAQQEKGAYQQALERASAACELVPGDAPDRASAIRTLAAAHYRVGQTDKALPLLWQSYRIEPRSPTTLAFLAMTQKTEGRNREAESTLAELRTLLEQPEFKPHRYLGEYLSEAEAVVLDSVVAE